MVAIPWPAIWMAQVGRPLEDRRVYESQIIYGHLGFDVRTFDDVFSYVSGEYLWGWILNLLVRTNGLSIDLAFGLISAFVTFTACLVITRHAPPMYTLLLFNPSFIDLAFSQLRIATALSMLCTAYLIRGPRTLVLPVRIALLAAACFVHTSMGIFITLFLIAIFVVRRPRIRQSRGRYTLLVGGGFAAALLLGPLRDGILAGLGDRRLGIDYHSYGLRFYFFWICMAIVMTVLWKRINLSVASAYALAALSTILFGLALGVYVNRVIAISLPFLVAAVHAVPKPSRNLLVVAYVGYVGLYWLFWLNMW
ncbi:hypothetical protein [Dietzia kunjamensis]|uniref:hypothetical protein n=1 Tax=Dietzia kunjamensis TaxID=322509 RepID=UPI0020973B86|nr:hypothetical protein [Dietzia kunjamensis]USX45200.1 hypothetical protein NHB83_13280 [Dietzia kunjamensis]